MNVTTDTDTVMDQGGEGNLTVSNTEKSAYGNSVDVLNESPAKPTHFPVLICMQCRTPLAKFDDIIAQRADNAWVQQVYAYELDIFNDKPPLWSYSATNPATHRFDLIRCSPTIATQDHLVVLDGEYSDEHSFFIGHKWCFCKCGTCGSFLGWGFSRSDESSAATEAPVPGPIKPSFIGLILTKCVGKDAYSVKKYEEFVRGASDRHQLLRDKEQTEERFLHVLNQLADRGHANLVASTYHHLMHGMEIDRVLGILRNFLHIAEIMLQAERGQTESAQDARSETEELLEQGREEVVREGSERNSTVRNGLDDSVNEYIEWYDDGDSLRDEHVELHEDDDWMLNDTNDPLREDHLVLREDDDDDDDDDEQ